MLSPGQRRATRLRREGQQILGNAWDRATGTFLPGCVGCRVDHDPADDPPAGVVGFAAVDEEMRERLGKNGRSGLRAVSVQVAQGRPDAASIPHGPRQLGGAPAGP